MNGSAGWGRIVPSLPAGPGRPAITWACLLVRRSARAICGGAVSIRPCVSRISAKPWSHRRTSCSVCCAPALAILTWPVPVTLRNGRRTASIPPERRPPMSRRDSISLAVCSMGRYWAPVARITKCSQPASTRPGIRNMAATSISPLAVMWLAINGPRN